MQSRKYLMFEYYLDSDMYVRQVYLKVHTENI